MTINGTIATAVKSRVGWLVFAGILLDGVFLGWIWETNNNRCEQLVAEHQRLIGMFTVAAQAAIQDGDNATAKVFQAYASSAKNTDVPNC